MCHTPELKNLSTSPVRYLIVRLPEQHLFNSQYNSSKAELVTVMLYGRVSLQLVQSTPDTLEAFPIVTVEHSLHPFKYEQITSRLNSIF